MDAQLNPIVIVATQRTPIGQFQGSLSSLSAPMLASVPIRAILNDSGISPGEVDEVIIGCVLPAGIGQAPARQTALAAGLPSSVPCTTINKMCGSGMKAIMLAHDLLLTGQVNIIVAGGMESMSNAPYLLPKARTGLRMGHAMLYDHMFLDGLEDAYDKGKLMGVFAERCAEKYGFSREMQDTFALSSLQKAKEAMTKGYFQNEISPVTVPSKTGDLTINEDELPTKAIPEKIPTLKPAFKPDGTVTAANSSAISDGAAVHLLMRNEEAKRRKCKPIAKIIAHSSHAQDPAWFTTAPIQAIQKVLANAQWDLQQVDLFEINEAFAVVALAAQQELSIPSEKLNIHGGACVLGHPIGASGARIVTTLIYALKTRGLKRGIAALCIGGGEATAIAIELCES